MSSAVTSAPTLNQPVASPTSEFPPVALHQPRSRHVSRRGSRHGSDEGEDGLPSPSALPKSPTTPGYAAVMTIPDPLPPQGSTEGGGPLAKQAPAPVRSQQAGGENANPHRNTLSEWNPSHPCYPHPNPHVALGSPLFEATKIIRIPRDWMAGGDLYPAFSITYPEILLPWVSEQSFRALIDELNDRLRAAFEPATRTASLGGVLGLLSGWVLEDLGWVGPKRRIRDAEAVISAWNAQRTQAYTGMVEGEEFVMALSLRRTAYMSLDIQIPDPKIRIVGEDEDGQLDDESTTRPSGEGGKSAMTEKV